MAFRAAIFDMDGVVVDTVPIHFKAWQRMFKDYGHDFTFEEYKQKVDGIPRIDGATNVLTHLSPEEINKASDKKQEYFLEELEKETIPVYQSTVDLIVQLQKEHVKAAVISSSKNARFILKRIGLLSRLSAVVSGRDIEKGKPDPEVFLKAAKMVNTLSSECVVFEDAILGVEAAKKAGMKCIGIDRYNDPDRLKKADLIVKDLEEVSYDSLLKLFPSHKS